MPILEFKCEQCGAESEEVVWLSDSAPQLCKICKGPLKLLISRPGVIKISGEVIPEKPIKSQSGTKLPLLSNNTFAPRVYEMDWGSTEKRRLEEKAQCWGGND